MLGTSARLPRRTLAVVAIAYRILADALNLELSHALGCMLGKTRVQVGCIRCISLLA